jgi:hypothetical protein
MLYLSSTSSPSSPTSYKAEILKDTISIHLQVQVYTRCTFIHKVHKVQMKDSFLV